MKKFHLDDDEVSDVLVEAEYALMLMRHQGALSCIIDNANKHFIYLSDEWFRLLGWSKKEMIGHSYWEFIHPDDIARSKKAEEDFVNHKPIGGKIDVFSNRYRTKDGEYKAIVWVGNSAINDIDSSVLVATAYAEDDLKEVCSLWKT